MSRITLILPLWLIALAAQVQAQTAEPKLTVATYNINFANRDLREVAETIRKADADIVCLQETNRRSDVYLHRELKGDYPHGRFQPPDGRRLASGFGILSKHPIEKVTFLPPEHGMFGTQITRVDVGGQIVRVVNVHLQPVVVRRGASLASAVLAFTATEQTHSKEIERIHGELKGDLPTIITGDFNSMPGFAAPAFLEKNGFTDSLAAANEDADLQATWHWPTKRGEWRLRIDYLYHDARFTTGASRVVEAEASDHFLLVSELELAEVPSPGESP